MGTETTIAPGGDHRPAHQSRFVFEVDAVDYYHDRPKITGAQLMAVAGIDLSAGLVQCFDDGTQQTIGPDDIVRLVPRPQFRRRPRFKRG